MTQTSNKEKNFNFFYYLFGFKKINTPLQLALVIGTHLVAWIFFFTLPLLFFRIEISDTHFLEKELINKLFLIGFFYFNYFFLIPRFFFKRERITYGVILGLSVLLLFAQHIVVERIFFTDFLRHPNARFLRVRSPRRIVERERESFYPPSRDSNMYPGPFPHFRDRNEHTILSLAASFFFRVMANVLSSTFLMVLIGGFIHLVFRFIKSQDEKKSLENAGLQAEINLLKSQINPHFLFNTLNSIYAQAHTRSEHTEYSILKLSEILRYMIYDTTAEQIALDKDIHYLSSYIDLQRLRLTDKIKIDYKVVGDLCNVTIAPLLLITFIENAFKHGISYSHPSVITIHIEVFGKTLTLLVSNPIVSGNKFEHGGMGLKNAKRRLDLIYPGNYLLDIVNDRNFYVVNLKINLNSNELPDH